MLRLQKFLAQAGLGSRRSCEQLIKEKKISVNGQIATLGTKVSDADEVILTNPYRVDQIPSDDRLDVDKVLNSLSKKSIKANYFPDVTEIVEHLKNDCRFGDIVLIMSNGKFGNIHQRLLDAL